MQTFWKKTLTIVLVAVISFITSIGAVAYLVKNNKNVRAVLLNNSTPFAQAVPAGYAPEGVADVIDFTYAAEQAVNAVVHIRSVQNAKSSGRNREEFDIYEYFFGQRDGRQRTPQPRVGFGSGVIISTDGYIITNNHVIEGADDLQVSLNDDRTLPAKIIGTDPFTDIALLKIEATDLQTLPFGDSEKLRVGEWVLAVGNPLNLKSTVTAGIISAKGRGSLPGETDRDKISSYIQTDAAVNRGNSGGALVNIKGELIGINTALISETNSYSGYSFAVPISIAGKVVADLKEYGVVQRARLGVFMISPQAAKEGYDNEGGRRIAPDEKVKVLEGAYISEFAERSAAKEAGLEVGDVITAVNGVHVKSGGELQEQINKFRPGDKVKIEVDRYGTVKSYDVELRNAQGNTDAVAKEVEKSSTEVLGAQFVELTDVRKRELGVDYGVEVTSTTGGGKMQSAGIRKGFIILTMNNERISTQEDIDNIVKPILKGSSEDKGLFIRGFYPNGRTQHYAIDLVD
ncbi:MAG: trypsin-like peptidase domain-containing protein [Tannerella sp.]|nr:trypsin-like peptidase domain-containing protein [Tannerella sp.]